MKRCEPSRACAPAKEGALWASPYYPSKIANVDLDIPTTAGGGADLARGWREALREANGDRIAIPMRIWLLASVLTTRGGRHRRWWGECGEMVAPSYFG